MQVNETVRASSGFRHSTRTLAPGESLPSMPSLFEQVMACRNGMSNVAANDEPDSDDFLDDSQDDGPDDELDS